MSSISKVSAATSIEQHLSTEKIRVANCFQRDIFKSLDNITEQLLSGPTMQYL